MSTLPIPAKALAQHVIILGKTRSGKSSAMRLLVERLLSDGAPVCVIDPKGDWWGLKSSASGEKAGFPVIIFGGEHADVPIDARSGAYIGELVATGNRPCIIDLGGWTVADRTRFFIDFASALFRHTRGPRWLCIDEVHNFAPQGKIMDPDAGKMLHWANRLASEGAGKGVTLISASQRPQKVHKDFVSSNETLIAMRVIHNLDRKAIAEWIDGCADPAKGREVIATLAGMKRGEGWVWSPEIEFGPARVQFPLFKTYDSFAAPTTESTAKLKGWASVDLDDVRAKLATVVEEAKANDPKVLRAELAAARAALAKAGAAGDDAMLRKEIAALGAAVAKLTAEARSAEALHQQAVGEIPVWYRRGFEGGVQAMRDAAAKIDMHATIIRELEQWRATGAMQTVVQTKRAAPAAPAPRPAAPIANGAHNAPSSAIGPERRILAVLASVYPTGMTEAQWAVAAGMKRSGGTWGTYKSRLRVHGRVEQDGALWRATELGAADCGSVEPMPAPGAALVAFWADRIPAAGPMLRALAGVYPHTMSREELAAALGMTASGGTFGTYLSRLRSPGLVEAMPDHRIRASAELMGRP